jgi:peptidoglycan hydrolase-like protein with peptidoglycan-binding domain
MLSATFDAEVTMNLWSLWLIGPVWSLLFTAAFAQPLTPPTAPGSGPLRLDRQHIREMQQTLEVLGFEPGPADGVMGAHTKAALTRFQQSEQLRPTGTLDSQTRTTLAARRRDHVLELQKALKTAGVYPGSIDGVMGGGTRAALRRYARAPAPATASQLIDRFLRAYEPTFQQSP